MGRAVTPITNCSERGHPCPQDNAEARTLKFVTTGMKVFALRAHAGKDARAP